MLRHLNQLEYFIADKIPKSKEFEFDSTKSNQLLKIKKISFLNLLNNFKIQEIHYNPKSECNLGCHQKDKCHFARKACQVAEYIVKDLRTADCLFKFVDKESLQKKKKKV